MLNPSYSSPVIHSLLWGGPLLAAGLLGFGLGRARRRPRPHQALLDSLKPLTDSSGDLVLLLDSARTILAANSPAEVEFGEDGASLAGASAQPVLAARLSWRLASEPVGAFHLDAWGPGLFLRHRDGSATPVEVTVQPVPAGGAGLLLVLIRDRSRLVTAEEELRAALEASQAMEARLRQSQKLESLGTLAGGIAHDLNNVLGAIVSLAAGPRAQLEDADPVAIALDTISNACARGSGMTGGLLRYVRKEAEVRVPVDLNQVASEIVQLLAHGKLKGATVSLDLLEGLPQVMGDPGALSHALMNLCVNAADATPKDGAITLRTSVDNQGQVRLSVVDTGSGMSPDVVDRAMEPFFTTKPVGVGTGLGLALVASTMKAHGGTLELASEPGDGTEVTLVLPAAAQQALPQGDSLWRPLRILVVDDDQHLRQALCPLLESLGHWVQDAAGGREALRLCQEGLEVDVVLLDLDMPGLSGAQTLLRLLEMKPGLPVLMASGHDEQVVAQFLVGYPSAASIQKPYSMERLQAKLGEMAVFSRTAV